MEESKATSNIRTSGISQQSKRRKSKRFTYEFESDFRGIGLSLDVDDEGRLVVLKIERDGEAAAFDELRQGNLHIVNVGSTKKPTDRPANELLQQLITLPRPVRVEFSKTTVPSSAAMAIALATVAAGAEAGAGTGAGAEAEAIDEMTPPRKPSARAKPDRQTRCDDAGQAQRVSESVESSYNYEKMVNASEHMAEIPNVSQRSMDQWLQEDSDKSEGGTDKIIGRRSWNTANRMRGGNASDVKSVNPTVLASDLARGQKMREEQETLSKAETAAAAGSALSDKRVGPTKEVKAEDYSSTFDDETGTLESKESSSISQPQNVQGVIGEHGNRKVTETNLIDQRQDSAKRGMATSDESLDFGSKSSFTERYGRPLGQKNSKEECWVENTQQVPSQSRVSTTPQHLPTQFSREDLDDRNLGGTSTPAATTSAVSAPNNAVTSMKKSGAGKEPTAAAFSIPSSLQEAPGGRARETSQGSKRKTGVGRGRSGGGATATSVSREEEKLSGRNDQKRENAPPLSKDPLPPPPVPDPAMASGLDSAVKEGAHSPHVESTISYLIENHAPFPRCPTKSEVAPEDVRRWSFTAPMESLLSTSTKDPSVPPASGGVPPPPGTIDPNEGPANPRAMYGKVPPPVPPEKGARRRPSVIVLPEQAIEDDHSFRRSKSAVIIHGADQTRHASRSRSDGYQATSKTAVGSSLVYPSHARDVIGYKVEKIKLVEKNNEAQGEARAVYMPTKFGGRGNGGRPNLERRVGDTTATGRKQTGGSAAMPNAKTRRNEPQQVARGHSSYVDDILNSPRKMSWEQQLRTTSGTMNRSGTTASRPRKADKRSNDNRGRSVATRGENRGKARPVKETFNSLERPNPSTSANLATKHPAPTAWSGLHVNVSQTRPLNGTRQYAVHPSSARAETSLRHPQRRNDARRDKEEGEEEKGEAGTSLNHARESASGAENSRETHDHWLSSNSRAPSLELCASKDPPAVKAAAAAAAAAAAVVTTAERPGDYWKGKVAATAAQAAALSATPVSAETKMEHSVARVRVRVRSSMYAIAIELNEKGSVLLEEVAEAEKQRHGIRAATVTGLINDSTGDDVNLDAPARRSVSYGDDLIAVVVRNKARGRGEAVQRAEDHRNRECQTRMVHHEPVEALRDKSGQNQAGTSMEILSPLLSVDVSGSRQMCNTPENEIHKLRDDVARQLFSERRAAGEGIGAFNPPSKPLGSSPITPVTSGGRGASPENYRVTSPRSASPRGAPKGPGKSIEKAEGETSRPESPTRSVASGYTHYSGFSVRTHGRMARSQGAFMTQSSLSPEELDGILEEELKKSHKWSNRHQTEKEKSHRVWEERSSDYRRLQSAYEDVETARRDKLKQQKEVEAERMAVRNHQRAVLAESAREQAKAFRDNKYFRAKATEAAHRDHLQRIAKRKERENRELADKVQLMDRKREDVRDSFLDMVDNEKEAAIQALETPIEMLDRAVDEGNSVLEKKARRAVLRRQAKERVDVRQRAAKVLKEQRRRESTAGASSRTRQEIESSMTPGPGQYNIRDFSEYGGGTYSRSII